MHPLILRWNTGLSGIGTIEITAYFLAVTVGMVLGAFLLWRWSKRHGIDGNDALDLAIWTGVFGLVGAKLMHVIADGYFMEYVHICTDPSQVFWDKWRVGLEYCRELGGTPQFGVGHVYRGCVPTESNCLGWINLFAGGYTWYGGLILGGAAAMTFIRRRKLPLWPLVDTLTWIVFLGLGFGRLGCFFNGCCFGHVSHSWVGVVFPPGSPSWVEQGQLGLIGPHEAALPVLPTQLFEAAAAFAITAFLALWVVKHRRYVGQAFVVGLALYACARITLEMFRADPRGGALGISSSQWVGVAMLIGTALLHRWLRNRPENAVPEATPPVHSAPPDASPPQPPAEEAGKPARRIDA